MSQSVCLDFLDDLEWPDDSRQRPGSAMQVSTAEVKKIPFPRDPGTLWDRERRDEEAAIIKMAEGKGLPLKWVPVEKRGAELCMKAVRASGWALQYVPEGLRTREMCETAVEDAPQMLCFVPAGMRTSMVSLTGMP